LADGVNYFFVDDALFDALLAKGKLVEWVEIYGHRYGLSRELARRLRGRGSETEAQVALRLGQAKYELSRFREYDFLVVNRQVDQAFRELEAIITAHRARQERRCGLAQTILESF